MELPDTLTSCSDEDLLIRYRKGQTEAFGVLVRRYERELYGYLRRYLGDGTLAEDVFQNTFVQLFVKSDQYEAGRPQPSFDKQFVRDYCESLGWDKTYPGPELPDDVVAGTRARYVDAFAPMVYWGCVEPGVAADQALSRLSKLAPVHLIGQAYDMAAEGGRLGAPPAAEVARFLDVAHRGGAVGASFWDWQEMTDAEWGALTAFEWRIPARPRAS